MAQGARGVEARSAAIADAATSILANEGWGALNAASVAREARCTVATVRARATTRIDLARMAWQRRAGERIAADLAYVSEAADAIGRTGDLEPLVFAWSRITGRTLERDAAMELLVVANTNPEVAAITDPGLLAVLDPADSDPLRRLRRIAAVAIAFGLALTNRHPWAQDRDLRQALTSRAGSLAQVSDMPGPPDDAVPYLTEVPVLADDDPVLDSLLRATVDLIATRGADDITVREIAEAAGATEGLVFSRYPTKLALVSDALHRHTIRMWESMAETGMRNAMLHGPAMAGAIYATQWLDPSRASVRAVNLEQVRVSWHHTPLLIAAIERMTAFRRTIGDLPGWAQLQADLDFFLDFADGIGVMLIQRFVPDAGDLPWLSISTARAAELYGRSRR
jgi:AcrR family transcriptional regulator